MVVPRVALLPARRSVGLDLAKYHRRAGVAGTGHRALEIAYSACHTLDGMTFAKPFQRVFGEPLKAAALDIR